MRRVMLVAVALAVASCASAGEKKAPAKGIEGNWHGALKAGVLDLRLGVAIKKADDGTLTGTLDSVDQGAKGIPIEVIEVKDRAVRLELKMLKAVFDGEFNEAATEIKGKWKQAGGSLDLTLKRLDKPFELARPQHPKKPFPYDEHEVTFENKPAKMKFAGTLTTPRGKGPFPVVLMLTGSGPQDRDETIAGHKPFLVIADNLTRRGIAVLRLDDRGVGGSTGNIMLATLDDNVQDALAAIAFLKTRPEIDATKIGLVGHSEGGLLAPYVASKTKDVAFLVLLAGTGLPGEEILYLQGQAILKSMGVSEAALKKQRELQEMIFTVVKEEPDNDKAIKKLNERIDELKAKLNPLEQIQLAGQKKLLEAQLKAVTTPWFRSFLAYDPRPTLRKTKLPVLAIIGEKDVQVPPKENIAAIRKALDEAGNTASTVEEIPGLNHLFQTATTGAIGEYGRIEETFAPQTLEMIGTWILKRTSK